MTDRRSSPLAMPLKFMLWLCSLIYGAIVRLLSTGYEKRFFIPYKADPKVISIGNITVGGTGKTQAAMTMAKMLESIGKKPAILIRGYGADEYKMLQEELRDIPILVGPDRIKNSKRAFYDFGVDTVILDDGFQHYKIYRDLDIILVDATNPFGNHELIPRGILREPITALRRAGVIVVNKVDSASAKIAEAYSAIDKFGGDASVLEAIYKPLGFYDIPLTLNPSPRRGEGRGEGKFERGLECVKDKKVCLVSSIGNPGYFKENILKLGVASIESEFEFMDHYNYKKEDFFKIEKECRLLGVDFIIVTKKDAVKIKRLLSMSGWLDIPMLVLEVDFMITKNKKVLYDRLFRVYSGKAA